ncbi:MAG: hypothetical protein K9M75_11315 [Phycisphaerae bacterium]|nr:hypothetical protein [Phycisphaerae bacterium]
MCAKTVSTGDAVKPVRRKFRALKWISVVIAGLLLLVFFGVPAFLSSSAGTGFVVNKVNKSVDGKIGMGDLNVGWFKGVHLKEFSFADDKGLATVNVRQITAKPSYTSMLSGNISLGKVVVDKPEVSIRLEETASSDKSAKGEKGEKGEKVVKGEESGKGVGVFFNQIDLTIKDGDVKILPAGADVGSTIHFSNIASKVDLKPAGERSSFDIGMDVENKGQRSKVSANGNVESSKKGWSFKNTEGDMKVKIDDLDLATLSPVFALLGKDIEVGGKLNVDAEAKFGDGQVEKLVVDAKLDKFKHVADGKLIALAEPVTLTGRVSTKNDKVNIEDINLRSSFCTITGKGTGSELDYVAKMDVGKTMDFVGTFVDLGGYSFAGTGYEEGHVTFKDDTIRFSDHSGIDNFVMGKKDVKGNKMTPPMSAKFTFDMTVDTKKENVKIDFLTMKTTDTLADIRIEDSEFSWNKDVKESMDMKLISAVDLAKVKPFAMFFEAVPEKMDLAGKVNSEMLVKSSGSEYKVVTDRTTVRGLKVATEGVAEKFEDDLVKVKLDMMIDSENKSFTLNEFVVDGTKIDVEGSIKQSQVKNDKTKVSGKVTAKYDLADVSTVASAYLPEGIEVAGKRSDLFIFESEYPTADKDKLMANLSASGKFGFDRAKYIGMKIGSVNVAANIKNGVLDIAPFSTSVNNGLLNFAGSIDFSKEPMVFTTPKPMQIIDKVEVDDEMGKALLKYLNPLFAEQTNLSGVASLNCEKLVMPLGGDTAIRDAQIVGTVAMSDVTMKNQGLLGMIMSQGLGRTTMTADMLPTKIVLDKGLVSYDNMQVNIDKTYPINFKGDIDLNQKPGKLKMVAALPYTLSVRDGGIKPLRVDGNPKGRIELPIKGTVEKNGIDWKGVLEGTGRKAAEEFIKEGLESLLKKKSDDGSGKSAEEEAIEKIFDLF